MKSLKDYSLNLSENDYHAYPAWSYSLIARYAKEGFGAIADLHKPIEQTDSMRFGSLFDCMLTRGKETHDGYVVLDMDVPAAEKNVLDCLLGISKAQSYIEVTDNELQTAIANAEYQSRWKFDTQKAHIDPYGSYFDVRRSGKTVVSQKEWDDAYQMYQNVKSDPYLKEHFRMKSENGKEYIYQSQFLTKFEIDGKEVMVKIMPDMLEVDHNNKTIQPWDVKTSSVPGYDFAEQFVRFRYDLQSSVYTDVLQDIINQHDEYMDYTILPYLFMDISRSDMVPVTYVYDPRDFSQVDGLSFGSDKVYQYKNWKTYLAEIIDYETTMTKVPSYITTTGPNDLLSILNRK